MKISRIKNQISEAATEACGYSPLTKVISEEEVNRILEQESGWIPCSERLPEEHDSMFIKFKGTKKWSTAMFERKSDEVIVTVADDAGRTVTTSAHTTDGKWRCDLIKINGYRVIAWMPLPEPYSTDAEKPHIEKPQTNADRIRSMTDEELLDFLCSIETYEQGSVKTIEGGVAMCSVTEVEQWLKAESEG